MAKEKKTNHKPHGLWSGTLSFGLVSVPVSLFPALRSGGTSLRMLDEDGTPLSREYVCSKDGKPLDADDRVRGYEMDDGKMITVTDEDLESLAPERTNEINLKEFVDPDDIPVTFFDRPYFLAPGKGSLRAYRLLAHVMEESRRAGIATFVMRGKEYLVAILAESGLLMAETLRFAEELRTAADVGLPEPKKGNPDTVQKFKKDISNLSRDHLRQKDLEDHHAKELKKLINKKKKTGQKVGGPTTKSEEKHNRNNTIDLVAEFKRRMREADGEEEAGDLSENEMEGLTKEELYQKAQQKNITGRSHMNKQELLRALSA